ncbi:hypothetical protein CUU62_22620 [Pseudomonas sp. WP001]|nr:hypothetical protein CUU62_22620 [Pseudomonas sp. WP001]
MRQWAYPNTSQSGLFVGASLLAKNSQAPRSFRKHALSLTFFASKLAPTDGGVHLTTQPRPNVTTMRSEPLLIWHLILISGAPLNHAGRTQARCRVVGQERFAYFCAFQK